MPNLSDEAIALLDGPNLAHLATLQADGSPKVEPVWIARRGNNILVTTDAKSLKTGNLRRDPRVALSIVHHENPWEQLLVRGRIVAFEHDDDLEVLDAMSQRYIGRPFPRRRWSGRVVFVIEPSLARYYRSPLGD